MTDKVGSEVMEVVVWTIDSHVIHILEESAPELCPVDGQTVKFVVGELMNAFCPSTAWHRTKRYSRDVRVEVDKEPASAPGVTSSFANTPEGVALVTDETTTEDAFEKCTHWADLAIFAAPKLTVIVDPAGRSVGATAKYVPTKAPAAPAPGSTSLVSQRVQVELMVSVEVRDMSAVS